MNDPVSQRRLDLLSLGTFVALGLPDGMLGTAWPSMRADLHAPVGDLGLILLAYTAGAIAVSSVAGRLVRRAGVAGVLVGSGVVAAAASAGFAASPALGLLVGSGVLFGVAGGTMDGALNIAVGMSGRGRLLNLLHGFYGIGTTLGPLVVTVAVLTSGWRASYLALLAVDAAVAAMWLAAHRTAGDGERRDGPRRGDPKPAQLTGNRRAALTGVAAFFVYTGLEVSAGQWETTFGRGELHLSAAAAGLATFAYWAALTAGRIVLAVLPRPPRHRSVVRAGGSAALVAAAVIWWQPATAATLVAFAVLGVALAGLFPALIALTPDRVGHERAPDQIAWQIGAASAGGACLSALVGLLLDRIGMGALGPSLTVLAVVLVGTELAVPGATNTRSPRC